MKCSSCGAEVDSKVKFCPNCGSQLPGGEARSPEDVDRAWLAGIMTGMGFQRRDDLEGENEVFGTHEKMFNLSMQLLKGYDLIGLRTGFNTKKIGPRELPVLLAALNKANATSNITTWFTNDEHSGAWAYSFITMGTQISERDIVRFIERFNDDVRAVINGSGLLALLQ